MCTCCQNDVNVIIIIQSQYPHVEGPHFLESQGNNNYKAFNKIWMHTLSPYFKQYTTQAIYKCKTKVTSYVHINMNVMKIT